MTTFDYLHQRLEDQAGITTLELISKQKSILTTKDLPVLLSSKDLQVNWDAIAEPIKLMQNRMMMGRLRYPPVSEQRSRSFDCVTSMRKRLDLYERTGNLEPLIDVANIACIEFITSRHPNKHFNPSDDGLHTKEK